MKLCRFKNAEGKVRVGLAVDDGTIADLSGSGVESITSLLEDTNGTQKIRELAEQDLPKATIADVTLLTPVEGQEVWAAGVTYLRSKKARMEESDFSANAYDLVYEAARPEIFLSHCRAKSLAQERPWAFAGTRSGMCRSRS
jgi:2-dehydro-3-deoxy-D-arabinonate dehydratase